MSTQYHLFSYIFTIATISFVFFCIILLFPFNTQAQELQATQISGEVLSEEYDTLFEIQWGGGSLYQLKARLGTMNCMLNTLWVYDNNEWHGYNQYNVPLSLQQEFISQYQDTIPAGTLYASCYDLCSFDYDESVWNALDIEEDYLNYLSDPHRERCVESRFVRFQSLECTQDWDTFIKDHLLPQMSVMPNVCIVRVDNSRFDHGTYGTMDGWGNTQIWWLPNFIPTVNIERRSTNNRGSTLNTEVHELCHSNQEWVVVQQISPHSLTTQERYGLFEASEAGQKLIQLLEYTFEYDVERDEQERYPYIWSRPVSSVYREMYGENPTEKGAELCKFYILQQNNRGDYSTYLTPQIIDWLEEYIFVLSNKAT